jgi:hypothetical protein
MITNRRNVNGRRPNDQHNQENPGSVQLNGVYLADLNAFRARTLAQSRAREAWLHWLEEFPLVRRAWQLNVVLCNAALRDVPAMSKGPIEDCRHTRKRLPTLTFGKHEDFLPGLATWWAAGAAHFALRDTQSRSGRIRGARRESKECISSFAPFVEHFVQIAVATRQSRVHLAPSLKIVWARLAVSWV